MSNNSSSNKPSSHIHRKTLSGTGFFTIPSSKPRSNSQELGKPLRADVLYPFRYPLRSQPTPADSHTVATGLAPYHQNPIRSNRLLPLVTDSPFRPSASLLSPPRSLFTFRKAQVQSTRPLQQDSSSKLAVYQPPSHKINQAPKLYESKLPDTSPRCLPRKCSPFELQTTSRTKIIVRQRPLANRIGLPSTLRATATVIMERSAATPRLVWLRMVSQVRIYQCQTFLEMPTALLVSFQTA
jgi:hypothetical protein